MKNKIKSNAIVISVLLIVMVIAGLFVLSFLLGQKASAVSYVGVPRGMIHQAYVTYKDSDTITIQPGYGECCYDYWEITSPLDHDMTSLETGEDWHYIYIDDVNSVYPTPTIKDSTVEPSWSDTKLGWYNDYDRCIGVVWSPDGSATMLGFLSNSTGKYFCTAYVKQPLTNGNPNGTHQFLEASAYIPVNSISVLLNVQNSDSGDSVMATVLAADNGYPFLIDRSYYVATAHGWLDVKRGWSRDFYWAGYDNDENNFSLGIYGYQIER